MTLIHTLFQKENSHSQIWKYFAIWNGFFFPIWITSRNVYILVLTKQKICINIAHWGSLCTKLVLPTYCLITKCNDLITQTLDSKFLFETVIWFYSKSAKKAPVCKCLLVTASWDQINNSTSPIAKLYSDWTWSRDTHIRADSALGR